MTYASIEALNAAISAAWASAGDGRRLVFGEGPTEAPRLMLIGEAPGAQEEAQGRPFVGKAGQQLNAFLEAVALKRDAIRVSNTVKVRPTRLGTSGRLSNRPPNRNELTFFIPYLKAEIELVRPAIVATLGNTALQAVLGDNTVIGDVHGRPIQAEGCTLFPLYHPAAVIYNRALKETYEADLRALRDYLTIQT